MASKLRIGTRGSKLARAQTALVIDALAAARPDVEFETVVVKTQGDRSATTDLASLGVGVFVKELETALEDGRIDAAVHSLKDMPSELPAGFSIAAVMKRADPRDVLISRHPGGIAGLPEGARVGTGSARRRALLMDARPDLRVEPLRGNVDTRIAKLETPDGPNAAILAAAGLARLRRLETVSEYLDPTAFIPAVGQGALAIEVRADDGGTTGIVAMVNDADSHSTADAEREFLSVIRGGCSAPVSAYASIEGNHLTIRGFASDPDGRCVLRDAKSGSKPDAVSLGRALASTLLEQGAGELLNHAHTAATRTSDD